MRAKMHGVCEGADMTDKQRESEIALYLARRTYTYGALHVIFGAQPVANTVQLTTDENTIAALQGIRAVVGFDELSGSAARACAGLQGRDTAGCLDDALAVLGEVAKHGVDDALVEILRGDYARLFDIPGDAYVHTWESPYTGTEGALFQASTLDVRSYYHQAGYRLQAEKHFPDDHIAAMMDYLRATSQNVYETYADGRDDEAARLLGVQRRFLRQHVLSWVDVFARKVAANDSHGYYATLAAGMAAVARVDYAYVDMLLMELAAE